MSSYYARPENALRKAHDLVEVGEPKQALATLHAILTTRRYRQWQPTHEKIMELYVEKAVELQINMKDPLVQYRMICQTNMGSMQKILEQFQKLAEKKLRTAEHEAEKAGANKLDVDKDDSELSPEQLLMQAVSGRDAAGAQGRDIMGPWLVYMWEVYRTILEVLRNNQQLLGMYHDTARRGFEFCRKYERHSRFRRLCDILRNHLTAISHHSHQANAVDLKSPETQSLYLATRFEQLTVAAQLEAWQEAYRTIEDIHGAMMMTKTAMSPELMMQYYQKLTDIFWASGNMLFHAYSLDKYVDLQKKAGAFKDAETTTRWHSAVLLATLSVPLSERFGLGDADENFFDASDEGNMRLANMLGFKKEVPTRRKLLNSLLVRGFGSAVDNNIRTITALLEERFTPLQLQEQLKPVLNKLEQDELLSKYVPKLNELAVVRLLQQLARVYQSISLSKFRALAPEMDQCRMERVLMLAVKRDQVHVRLDHRTQMLHFEDDRIQADNLKLQLSQLASRLAAVAEDINGTDPQRQTIRSRLLGADGIVLTGAEEDHKAVSQRQLNIETRKQESEIQRDRKQALSEQRAREMEQKRREDEMKRLDEEKALREKLRLEREDKEKQLKEKKQLLAEIESKIKATLTGPGLDKGLKRMEELGENLEEIEKEKLFHVQAEVILQEKKEKERIHAERVKRNDFLQRALVLESTPRLEEEFQRKQKEDRERYAEQYEKFLDQKKKAHALALEEKARLSRMQEQAAIFRAKIMEKRQQKYQLLVDEQKDRINAYRLDRVQEVKRRREEEEARRIEEERLRQQEEEAAAEEARRAAEAEKRARELEAAQKEREAKLEALAERQRQREREIEQRDAGRSAGVAGSGAAAPYRPGMRRPVPGAAAAADSGADRDWGAVRSRPAAPAQSSATPDAAGQPGRWRPSGAGANPDAGASSGAYRPGAFRSRGPADSAGAGAGAYRPRGPAGDAPSAGAYRPRGREDTADGAGPARGAYRPGMMQQRAAGPGAGPDAAAGGGDRWRRNNADGASRPAPRQAAAAPAADSADQGPAPAGDGFQTVQKTKRGGQNWR